MDPESTHGFSVENTYWMNRTRMAYRARQFFLALRAVPAPEQVAQARTTFTPAQMALFSQLQASEQVHALAVVRKLVAQGETNPDLLTAALLHDVGKSRFPLRLWERVWIVLGKALFPTQSKSWGSGSPTGWRRPFVVAAQHPTWGAEMAAQIGVSPQVVDLIRKHQDRLPSESASPTERLLSKLQKADNEN
jgi:putative nucleotidyltransferase with HDIG domain